MYPCLRPCAEFVALWRAIGHFILEAPIVNCCMSPMNFPLLPVSTQDSLYTSSASFLLQAQTAYELSRLRGIKNIVEKSRQAMGSIVYLWSTKRSLPDVFDAGSVMLTFPDWELARYAGEQQVELASCPVRSRAASPFLKAQTLGIWLAVNALSTKASLLVLTFWVFEGHCNST